MSTACAASGIILLALYKRDGPAKPMLVGVTPKSNARQPDAAKHACLQRDTPYYFSSMHVGVQHKTSRMCAT